MIILDAVNVVLTGIKSEDLIINKLIKYGYDENEIKETLKKIHPYDYGTIFTVKEYCKNNFEEKKFINNIYNKVIKELNIKDKKLIKELKEETLYYKNRKLVENAKELLDEMSKKDKIILCSNAHPSMKKSLEMLKIKKYFKYIFISGKHQISKPNKKVYEFLINKFKVKPNECFYLDDMLENVLSAQSIGINSYLLIKPNNKMQQEDLMKTDCIVNKVNSLGEFYEKIKEKY